MKVTQQSEPEYLPISITLETRDEALDLLAVLEQSTVCHPARLRNTISGLFAALNARI